MSGPSLKPAMYRIRSWIVQFIQWFPILKCVLCIVSRVCRKNGGIVRNDCDCLPFAPPSSPKTRLMSKISIYKIPRPSCSSDDSFKTALHHSSQVGLHPHLVPVAFQGSVQDAVGVHHLDLWQNLPEWKIKIKENREPAPPQRKWGFPRRVPCFFYIFYSLLKILTCAPSPSRGGFSRPLPACPLLPRRSPSPPGSLCYFSENRKKISLKACFRKWEVNLLLEVPLRVVRPSWCRDCKCDNLQPCGLLGWRVKDCPAGLALPRPHSWRSTSWRWPARWRCRCWRCTQSWKTLQPAKWLAIR